ncbi:MAG TPA: outer membrane protein assembly factor, partial [Accumulibacter sp.]|nr:outer membrane protein assembly factor [Accumulibacter sp.]
MFKALLISVSLVCWWTVHADTLSIQAPDEVKELLTRHLRPDDFADLGDLVANQVSERKLQADAAELLATEGYFSPQVTLRRDGNASRLDVDPGPRSMIGEVRIEIVGVADESRRQALLAGWQLPSGQPFRQTAWDKAKQALLGELLTSEFATARLSLRDLVAHARALAAHVHGGDRV